MAVLLDVGAVLAQQARGQLIRAAGQLKDLVNVEWQLREVGGTFHRLPPKDDSYRSADWGPRVPVDQPPFLVALVTDHARKHPQDYRCACRSEHGGSGR